MSASPATFPSANGAMVPRDPADSPDRLQQERETEQINAPRLLNYLNKTLDSIAQLDQNENLKIHNQMTKCVAYYDGRWDGFLRNGEWVDNRVVDGEILPSDNEFKKQIDKLQMEMCRSRIGYESAAVDKFSAKRREAAQFAQRRIEVNQERIETDPFIEAENMSLLLKTIALRYTFFDRNAESQEQSVELNVMKHMTQGSKMAVCRTCGITAQQARPCPKCGDTEIREIEAPESEGIKTQQSKKCAGRVVTVRPDATMVQMDLNARDVQGSSFIRWRLVLRRCDWEAMFPNTRIPSSDESRESNNRSRMQSQASNTGDSWEFGSGEDEGGGQFEKIEGELVWLDPKVYQRYRNKENETLGDGRELPAGTNFGQQFPMGACVARIAQKILDIFPSNKNKCWTMCVYGLREHALHGSGTMALLGPQDIINESNAKILANQTYMAAGREFVRSGAIEGGQLPSYDKVGVIEGAPSDRNIVEWAYGRSQPATLAPDVYSFRQDMRGSLQDAAGTSSLSMQGAADVKQLGTATGVEASRDQAVGRMIPNRKLQAYAGSEWAMIVLELERENYTPETFLEMAGKTDEKGEVEYTERGVKAFFAMDVRTALTVRPKPGSWMPTTPAQDRANATDFASVVAQIGGEGGSPEMVSLLAPNYGIDFSVDEWGAAQRNASMRIEEYARVSDVIAKGGYPPSPKMVQVVLSNCAEWAQINPTMDRHDAFRNFYSDWWLSDEGRNADPLLRLVVQTVHDLHLNKGIVKQAQDQSAAALAAKAPEMVAQEAMAQQQKEQQDAAMASAEEQGKQDMVEQATGEQALAERDREHASDVKMAEAEQQAEIDKERAEHKARLDAVQTEHAAVVDAATRPEKTDARST